jgi:hypothetical protein
MSAAPDTAALSLLDALVASGSTTLSRGNNLFTGPVRAKQRNGTDIPDTAVFCLATGGPTNERYIGNTQSLRMKSLQVRVRGPRNGFTEAETIAVSVLEAIDHKVSVDFPGGSPAPAGFIDFRALEPHPTYIGVDGNDRHGFSINAWMRVTE